MLRENNLDAMTQYNNMLNSAKEYYNNVNTESSTYSKSLDRILKEIQNQRDDLKLSEHSSAAELFSLFSLRHNHKNLYRFT